MKTKKQQLFDQLDDRGWELEKIYENDLEWWGDEIWEIKSRRSPEGITAFITFLVDPMHEGNRKKDESVWAPGSSFNFPTTRMEAEEYGVASLGQVFKKEVGIFLDKIDYLRSGKSEIVRVSKELISKKIDFLDGIRRINSLRNNEPELVEDNDFNIFIEIDSDTDHIPKNSIEDRFSSNWINKCKLERKKVEESYRNEVETQCQKLIQRFSQIA